MNTFNVEKAAQITAYFALRAGGSIDELKVLKLVYIAVETLVERHRSRERDQISFDGIPHSS